MERTFELEGLRWHFVPGARGWGWDRGKEAGRPPPWVPSLCVQVPDEVPSRVGGKVGGRVPFHTSKQGYKQGCRGPGGKLNEQCRHS